MSFPPTAEQAAIIEKKKDAEKMLIKARAGCAKTDTGVRISKAYPKRKFKFIVFGKKNAEEFAQKLPSNASGSTRHSFCNSFIKQRYQLDKSGFKMFKIISKDPEYNFKNPLFDKEESFAARENLNAMKDLVGLLKNSFIQPTMVDVETIINHFGISFSLPMEQVCSDAIDFLLTSDEDTKELDYNDMVRLPIISGLIRANFDEFFLDEAQDNTPISNELLKQVRKQGCSVTCCGDDFQAIMGFCGADSNSLNNIITAIEPEIMPLTVNFRCGKNIIAEAQRFVPDIKAWDSSPDGVVSYSKTDDFMKKFSNGDCALSRFNRVIIPICFRLIREGKKATIQGRDFGSMLKALVAGFKATSIDGFYEAIDKWKDRQLEKSKSLSVSDAIEDKFECLKHFADNSDTVEQIATTIDNIFSDKETEGLKLSTAHRSKGLEWNNVFILDSNNFMQTRPTDQAWNVQQLRNLFYVAITRSKKELTYVNA